MSEYDEMNYGDDYERDLRNSLNNNLSVNTKCTRRITDKEIKKNNEMSGLDELVNHCNESDIKLLNNEIEQLKKENEFLKEESKRLTSGVRTINRKASHLVPESVSGDDEPCYWQRGEWIDYIFELVENVEILLTTNRG